MSGEGHRPDCPDCETCQECETRAAWCLSENPVDRPCPHLEPICSQCWPGSCVPCRLEAEQELYRTGVYTSAGDPFYRPVGREPVTLRDALADWWDDLAVRRAATGFDPVTQRHHRPSA